MRSSLSERRVRVLALGPLLSRGLLVADAPDVWRRPRTRLPVHLARTKTSVRAARPTARGSEALAQHVRRVLHGGWAWHRRGRTDGYPIAVVTFDGGFVLLDPGRGTVRHHYPAALAAGYGDLRRRFGRHVPSPGFEVLDGGRVVVEEYVDGAYLTDLPPQDQIDAVGGLVHRYADLTRSEAEGTCADVVRELDEVLRWDLPTDFRTALAAPWLTEALRRWPLVPSATDAHPKNLVVAAGRTAVVDLGTVRLEPFCGFPVGVVLHTSPHVLGGFLEGALDAPFGALLAAAGARPDELPGWRTTLLALRLARTARRGVVSSGVGLVSGPELVVQRWAAVRAALARGAPG
nr:hypothetical protein [uncultured Actinotalea sp.]